MTVQERLESCTVSRLTNTIVTHMNQPQIYDAINAISTWWNTHPLLQALQERLESCTVSRPTNTIVTHMNQPQIYDTINTIATWWSTHPLLLELEIIDFGRTFEHIRSRYYHVNRLYYLDIILQISWIDVISQSEILIWHNTYPSNLQTRINNLARWCFPYPLPSHYLNVQSLIHCVLGDNINPVIFGQYQGEWMDRYYRIIN